MSQKYAVIMTPAMVYNIHHFMRIFVHLLTCLFIGDMVIKRQVWYHHKYSYIVARPQQR